MTCYLIVYTVLITVASSSCDEAGCEEQELASFKLLQTKQSGVSLGTAEKPQLNALLQSLWNGEIAMIHMHQIIPLISKVAKANLNFSEEETEKYMKKWDRDNDGKLDIKEIPKPTVEFAANTVDPPGDEYTPSKAPLDADPQVEVPIEPDVPGGLENRTHGSLIQSNTTGSWGWVVETGVDIQKYQPESLWFSPRVDLNEIWTTPLDSIFDCMFASYGVYNGHCNDVHRYFYTNGDMCRCYPPGDLAWKWYHSSSGNYIYYFPWAPLIPR